jgi:hypothetical protein
MRLRLLLLVSIFPFATARDTALRVGEALQLECLLRDDEGEVLTLLWPTDDKIVEDSEKERVYSPFMICNETGQSPTFNFRQPTNRARNTCTVEIDDPTFHLFENYLHHDMPLACRIRSSAGVDHWAHVPINLLGKVQLSHFDVEKKINFLFHYSREKGWISGGVGYSLGPAVTLKTSESDLDWERVKIGDQVQFELSVRFSRLVDRLIVDGSLRQRCPVNILTAG